MECPRGSVCTESAHQVKTLAKAREWYAQASEDDLPLRIEQWRSSDGRLRVIVYGANGDVLTKRG